MSERSEGITLAELDGMPLGKLTGVGAKREAGFAALDVHTLYDVLTTYPRRYIDRTNSATIRVDAGRSGHGYGRGCECD